MMLLTLMKAKLHRYCAPTVVLLGDGNVVKRAA